MTDLYEIARMFGTALPASLGLQPGRARGTIVVTVVGGRITGWRTTTVNFLSELEKAGVSLPRPLADYESGGLAAGQVLAQFARPGQAIEFVTPPADQTVPLTDDVAAHEQALADCARG